MAKKEIMLHVAELFDLPQDLAAGLPHMELLGNREFFIEGHGGILSYGEEEISLSAGKLTVRVRGQQLRLIAMTEQEVRIGGHITDVSFPA